MRNCAKHWSSRPRRVKSSAHRSSPTDLQPVLDTIAMSAAQMCSETTR